MTTLAPIAQVEPSTTMMAWPAPEGTAIHGVAEVCPSPMEVLGSVASTVMPAPFLVQCDERVLLKRQRIARVSN